MYTRGVRIQLVVFGVIAALSIGYMLLGYADGKRTVGLSNYEITADFRDTSGLYPRALVTYRGVQVGRVRSLDLTDEGVDVTLSVDSGIRIPSGTLAEIHSVSAVGEQYVDLVPARNAGPYLPSGATIPRSDTREMPQIAPVLDKLNGLLESVPKRQTTRLMQQVDTAFGESDVDLQLLLESSTDLLDTATAHLGITKELVKSVQPVLETQIDLGTSTRSYISSLAGFTGELKDSDPQLRSLLAHGTPSLAAVDGLLDRLSPSFAILMANLVSTGEVTNVYVPSIKQTLVVYPALINRFLGTGIVHEHEGSDKLDIKLNLNDPPSCTQGYLPRSQWRDPADTSPLPTPPNLHCTNPRSESQGVRGARNYPCPVDTSRRAASPAGCGLYFPGEQSAPYRAGSSTAQAGRGSAATADAEPMFWTILDSGEWTDLFTGPLALDGNP